MYNLKLRACSEFLADTILVVRVYYGNASETRQNYLKRTRKFLNVGNAKWMLFYIHQITSISRSKAPRNHTTNKIMLLKKK